MSAILTIGAIRHRVAVAYGVDPHLLTSSRRTRALVRPRQVAMWLAARLLPASPQQISRAFGAGGPAGVLHALARVEALRADAGFRGFVDGLEAALAPAAP